MKGNSRIIKYDGNKKQINKITNTWRKCRSNPLNASSHLPMVANCQNTRTSKNYKALTEAQHSTKRIIRLRNWINRHLVRCTDDSVENNRWVTVTQSNFGFPPCHVPSGSGQLNHPFLRSLTSIRNKILRPSRIEVSIKNNYVTSKKFQ